jgi:localization factor PodJL
MTRTGERDGAGDRGAGKGLPPYDPLCRADDLKSLLRDLADQIADTDRRHSDALRDLHARIATLGGQAELARSGLPSHLAPAFERIEDSLGQLAERIVEADRQRQHARAAAIVHDDLPVAATPAAAPAFAATASIPAMAAVANLAAPAPQAIEAAPAMIASSGPASTPTDATDPWDMAAADALHKLYDSGEAGPAPAEVTIAAPPPGLVAAMMPMMAPAAAAKVSDIDREWLDGRLAEISRRVEQSLADVRPDAAIHTLGARFDQLEQRFTTAVEGVATRADVEGLRIVEAHINEIFNHVEHAQSQLERLSGIETQISSLSDRLSEERVARMVVEAMPTDAELTTFAETAAERAAQRVIADLPASASMPASMAVAAPGEPDPRLDRIHGLIEAYINERRAGDEQTAGALDTLQQAMQHLLDRIESIETRTTGPAIAQPTALEPRTSTSGTGAGEVRGAGLGTYRVGEAETRTTEPAQPERIEPELRMGAPAAREVDEEPAPPAGARSRDDFIAAARRAARQAASSPAPAATSTPKAAPRSAAVAAPVKASAVSAARAKLFPADKGIAAKPGVLLVACISALLATGAFMIYAKAFRSGPQTAKLERKMLTPETEARDKAARDGNKALPGSAPDDAAVPTGAPATPRPSGASLQPTDGAAPKVLAMPAGITIDMGTKPATPADLARAENARRLAALSEKAGQTMAPTGAPAAATVASAIVSDSVDPTSARPAPAAMPPATIGPNSLRLAAANGDPSAQFDVAIRFAEGKGVPQDAVQAAIWLQRAAAQGFAAAQYRLATAYERGLGVPADPARARAWYLRAAQSGNVKAMHNLAVMSANKESGAPDYVAAIQWFNEAAERGLADSQFNLAILIEGGLGVPKDLALAYKWYSLAARGGDREAVRRRDALKARLSPDELQDAVAAVAAWRAKPVDLVINDVRAASDAWKSRAVAQPAPAPRPATEPAPR